MRPLTVEEVCTLSIFVLISVSRYYITRVILFGEFTSIRNICKIIFFIKLNELSIDNPVQIFSEDLLSPLVTTCDMTISPQINYIRVIAIYLF